MAKKSRKMRPDPPVDPRFAPIVAAFSKNRDVARKRMFSSSNVLTVNGKIFAMLVKGRFVAKLPKARVDALTASGRGAPFDPGHGRLMKEWVAIGEGDADWLDLAKEAYRFVRQAKTR
jgi:TfoX/Sxy family transcriptional regulator of competence genes